MRPVEFHPAARSDLLDQAEYYDSEGGEELSSRFMRQCEAGFERLAKFPASGAPTRIRHTRLRDCRFILVPGFDQILIFYLVAQQSVVIVRVLHGARDIEALLEAEEHKP
jgi:toxin ParE1/3/4